MHRETLAVLDLGLIQVHMTLLVVMRTGTAGLTCLYTLVLGFSHVDVHAEYEVGGERWGLELGLSEYKCVCVW